MAGVNPFSVLGLEISDFYDGMAGNVLDVLKRTDEWDDISEKVKGLSIEEQAAIAELAGDAYDDREFFSLAGIKYGKGSPNSFGILIAFGDYVLRRDDLNGSESLN